MADKVVLWDFDGTLAWRDGLWGSALMQALDEHEPGHGVCRDDLRPHLRDGFPWHRPERPHPELCDPSRWWAEIEGLMARAFQAVGFASPRAEELARAAHQAFVDPSSYCVFEDTEPTLEALARADWRHIVLSNHVPELEDIVAGVGLRRHFDGVLSSALIGYEKPHAQAFRGALEHAGRPDQVWMVGDNPLADVGGALAAGIPAILVRRDFDYSRKADDMRGVVGIITEAERRGGRRRA